MIVDTLVLASPLPCPTCGLAVASLRRTVRHDPRLGLDRVLHFTSLCLHPVLFVPRPSGRAVLALYPVTERTPCESD